MALVATAPTATLQAFLRRHDGTPVAGLLRAQWLAELARRGDWATYRAVAPQEPLAGLPAERRCAALRAQLAAGADARLLDAIAAAWLSGSSLPALCDPAFAALESAGRITPALTWKRVALAVESGNAGLLRHLAGKLPDADAAQVRAWAGFLETPDDDARPPACRWAPAPLANGRPRAAWRGSDRRQAAAHAHPAAAAPWRSRARKP